MSARRLLPLLPFLLPAPVGDPPDDRVATVHAFRQHDHRADTLDVRDAAIPSDRQRQPPGPAAATDDKAQP